MTADELNNILEETTEESNLKIAASLLYNSINDWPISNLSEPNDFILELKKEVGQKLNYGSITKFLNRLSPATDAWKIESLTSLIELFDLSRTKKFDDKIELEKIIENIKTHYQR